MVEVYKGFRSSNGKIFDDARDAHIEELRVWCADKGIDNEAMRNAFVKAVATDPQGLCYIVNNIADLSPLTEPSLLA